MPVRDATPWWDEDDAVWRDERKSLVIEYAERGWPMVLLHGMARGEDGLPACDCPVGAECTRAGKHPRFRNWSKRATTNLKVLLPALERFPTANIGLVTGPRSGFVVLDLDPRHGSAESEKRLAAGGVTLYETLSASTGGGGEHLYYAWPVGFAVGNTLPVVMAKDEGKRLYDGIDVRGRGGFVVVPPSRHAGGGTYSWPDDLDTPVEELPSALLVGVRREIEGTSPPPGVNAWAWVALTRELQRIADSEHGERNDNLFKAARCLGEIIGGGGDLDEEVVTQSLIEAGEAQGLGAKEVLATIRSGLEWGAKTPRKPKPEIRNRDEALKVVGDIRAAMWSVPRGGHKGKRMRAVLEALLRLGMRAGGPVFTGGHRTIALEAGMSTKPVTQALRELIDEGWVVRLFLGQDGRSSAWRVRLPPGMADLDRPKNTSRSTHMLTRPCEWGDVGSSRHPSTAVGHDAYRRSTRARDSPWDDARAKGFDKTGWSIVDYLANLDESISQAALSRGIGIHRSTISRHLPRLIEHGLVTRSESGLRAAPVTTDRLDQVARRLRTDGASIRQRQEFGWSNLPDKPDDWRPEADTCPHRPSEVRKGLPPNVQPLRPAPAMLYEPQPAVEMQEFG